MNTKNRRIKPVATLALTFAGLVLAFQNCGFKATESEDSFLSAVPFSPESFVSNSDVEQGLIVMQTSPPRQQAPASKLLSNRQAIHMPGCNSPTWKQIPGMPNHFVGRVKRDAPVQNLDSCQGGEVYTLAWAEMDWEKGRLQYLGKMIDLNAITASIQGGKYTLSTSYDPSIIFDGQEHWLAFECHGQGFPGTAAACLAPVRFASPGGVDLSRASVAILGVSHSAANSFFVSGSVPKLMNDNGRIYLYWSMVRMPKNSAGIQDWTSLTTRGIELVKDSQRRWVPKGFGPEMPADHPLSVEVMGRERATALTMTADAFDVKKIGSFYYLIGATGDCYFPAEAKAGCYRMTIRRASSPLGHRIFNEKRVRLSELPSNWIQYFHFVENPKNEKLQILGYFGNSYMSQNVEPTGGQMYDVNLADSFFEDGGPLSIPPEGDEQKFDEAKARADILALAQEVWLRSPFDHEMNAWVEQLRGGKTLATLRADLLASHRAFVIGVYRSEMLRGDGEILADLAGVDYWTQMLAEQRTTRADVSSIFRSSHERFLKDLYVTEFRRPADAAGLRHYILELESGRTTRSAVQQWFRHVCANRLGECLR